MQTILNCYACIQYKFYKYYPSSFSFIFPHFFYSLLILFLQHERITSQQQQQQQIYVYTYVRIHITYYMTNNKGNCNVHTFSCVFPENT